MAASWVCTENLVAQADLKAEDAATMAFELDVKALRESKLLKAIGFETLASQMGFSKDMTGIDPMFVDRLSGGIRWPDDLNEMIQMQPGVDELPMSFFWLVEFNAPAAGTEFKEEMEEFLEKVERNGEEFFAVPEAPSVLIQVNEKHFMACTENYLSDDFRGSYSDGLKTAFAEIPENHMFRAALDIKTSRKMLDGMFEIPEDDMWMLFPFPVEGLQFIKAYEHIDMLALSADLDDPTFLSLVTKSKDEASAKDFESQFSQVLSMARLGAMMGLAEIGIEKESDKTIFNKMLNQLKLKRDNTANRMVVKQPDGFDELLASVAVIMKKQADLAAKMNRFRQVGIAIHNFHDSHKGLPFNHDSGTFHKDLSWRARITPFTWSEDGPIEIELSEPWDSKTNKPFASQMPELFGSNDGKTDICWVKSKATNLERIMDGTSNTIMLIENPNQVPWTQPEDLTILKTIKLIQGLEDGQKLVVVMYDCSTHQVDNTLTLNEIKALLTPSGGETGVSLWNR